MHDGFNEAAGIPRGRRRYGRSLQLGTAASMRPRVFPAEDMARNRRHGKRLQ